MTSAARTTPTPPPKQRAVAPDAGGSPAAEADEDLAAMCKALGHPVRIQILRMLAQHGRCYFGSIADAVAVAPSTASQHLSVLKEAGLIKGWADEQRSCFCVDQQRVARLAKLIGGL